MISQDLVIKRLLPGQDLKKEILALVREHQINAGVVLSSVGSLTRLSLRLANENQTSIRVEFFEIISLNGSLSMDGVHLHISAADSNGTVMGGHLLDGCIVHTTCELVLMKLPGVQFSRRPDENTGFLELVMEKK